MTEEDPKTGNRSPATLVLAPLDELRAPSSIENAEHAAAVLRVRAAFAVGGIAWTAATGIDFWLAKALAPQSFGILVALRALGCILSGAGYLFLRRSVVSRGALRLVTLGVFGSASVLFGAMSVAIGDIGSPYFSGVMVMLLVYGPMTSTNWRRGAVDAAVPTLAHVATLLTAARFDPVIAAQFRQFVPRTVFFVCFLNLLFAYAVVVASGHAAWVLRRQVFASRSLGRYKLKRLLGAGGMGEVWLAHHAALKRDVAVKVMRRDRALLDAYAVARFEREARATSELTHPNTIRIHDYGLSDDGVWYYAMELLQGVSLGVLVGRTGPLPAGQALEFLQQAARALAEAHAKGIVHRDITPENLFIVSAGGVRDFLKVLDFGIAKVLSPGDGSKLTHTGHIVGTPAWMAPEILSGAEADARADVYSLGAVLYLALTGHHPFARDGELSLADALSRHSHVPMSERRGVTLSPSIERVVARCLEPARAARFQTAGELADALARCEDEERLRSVHSKAAAPVTLGNDAQTAAPAATLPSIAPERSSP